MNPTYLLPIAAAICIMIFYCFLPPLKTCRLPAAQGGTRRDRLFIVILTLAYALVAFWGLGDTAAPQTVRGFAGDCAVLELSEPSPIAEGVIYTGIGQGSYSFEFSPDGEDWLPAASYEQGHAALLKWQRLDLAGAPTGAMRYVRVTGWGGAELGEVAFFNAYGDQLPLSSADAALCDEQGLVPSEISYLNSSYFDEIYHARTAWEHLRGVYPYEVSHPPLGKLILSLGIALFGMTPFGWRFMGTLFGVLMLPLIWWFARKLYGGRTVPGCCAALLAADFMHFVQTRIATIDTYAVFFILLMYGFLWLFVSTDRWRYLALSGLFFGLGAASKWTCLYAGAGLGVIWLGYWLNKALAAPVPSCHSERSEESPKSDTGAPSTPLHLAFLRNVGFCLVFFVALPALIYVLAYLPYGAARGVAPFSADYFKLVWDNQVFMFTYHAGVDATHPYSSRWYQWLLDIRPILYYLDYGADGTRSSFGAWVNPVLCWAGFFALFVLGYAALFRRDKKAAFLLVGYLAQLVPWMFIRRVTFEYHYFPCAVFLILALGYVFSLLREAGGKWRAPVIALTALSVLVFVLFYPALTGLRVDNAAASRLLKWLPTWPFIWIIP